MTMKTATTTRRIYIQLVDVTVKYIMYVKCCAGIVGGMQAHKELCARAREQLVKLSVSSSLCFQVLSDVCVFSSMYVYI